MIVGDKIKCHDLADMKKILIDLCDEGIEAIVCDATRYVIRITGIPEEDKSKDEI